MAQGAKPGEGGQLPGQKVYPWIAETRYSTPGVGLISPPPHHDIYSIEDLAQLIHDLKNANPRRGSTSSWWPRWASARSPRGSSKAHADVVLISGHDGGTGASPLTSLKHAGGPWELGLAETQQTLLLNGLRDRIVVQTDGQLKTGRDVVIAALLGAEEFGFATAPLVVSRLHHDAGLPPRHLPGRRGHPEPGAAQAVHRRAGVRGDLLRVRRRGGARALAELGFRTLDEAIGRAEALDVTAAVDHWKAAGLDLSADPARARAAPTGAGAAPHARPRTTGWRRPGQRAGRAGRAPRSSAASRSGPQLPIRNVNRTVGTILGHEVTKRYGGDGLPDGTIDITFTGSAGQSFGAFLPRGITLRLEGDANDYLAKGLSGGRIVVRPDRAATFAAEPARSSPATSSSYGATAGEVFLRGQVGERFCVRNSGATAVVEGVGDHGCEYMTGGRAVVLGPTGRNFAAGMSGGTAYVLDLDDDGSTPSWSSSDRSRGDRRPSSRDLVTRHAEETGSDLAGRCWPTGRPRCPGSPRSCRRLPAGAAPGPPPRPTVSTTTRRPPGSWRCCMADPKGFLTDARRGRRAAPGRRAGAGLAGGLPGQHRPGAAADHRQAGGPVHGLRHPVLPPGLPAGQPDPGVERPCLAGRLGGRSSGCTRPTTSRSSPAGSAPRRASPPACWRSTRTRVTIKNVEVSIIDKAWESGWWPRSPRSGSPARPSPWSAPARRAGRRPAAHPRRPHRRGLRAGGQGRRAAALRHPRVQDGEAPPGPAAGPDARGGHGVPRRCGRRRRRHRRAAAGALRRGRDRGRRHRGPRPAGARPGAGRILQAMEFLPPANRVALGETSRQITAEGKDVVIIGGGDTGADCLGTALRQGAARSRSWRSCPKPGVARPHPTMADLPDDLPGLRRRTRRPATGCTRSPRRSSSATSRAVRGRARLVDVSSTDGRLGRGRGHRAGDPGRAGAARDGLHRSRAARARRAARRGAGRARHHRPRRGLHVLRRRGLRRR